MYYGFPFIPYVLHVRTDTLQGAVVTLDVALLRPVSYYHLPSEFGEAQMNALHWIYTNAPSCCWSVEMAKTKNNRNFTDIEFVQCRITPDQAADFAAWGQKMEKKFMEMLEGVGASGYKIGLSPDLENECMIVSLTGTKHASRNVGKCITSRADTFLEATLLCLYKHIVLFQEGDWDAPSQRDNWG